MARLGGMEYPDQWFLEMSPEEQAYVFPFLSPEQQQAWAPFQKAALAQPAPMEAVNPEVVDDDPFAMTPLEQPPMVDELFSQPFRDQYMSDRASAAEQIGQFYLPPEMIDLSSVPQPSPNLLPETGYSPEILAAMRARVVDDASNRGVTALAQAKRGLGAAGMTRSGASSSIAEEIARRTGMDESAGLRDVELDNAGVALTNQRTNMAMINNMAMENAARMFSAMSQNIQAANAMNAARGSAQADAFGQSTGQFQNAALNRSNQAAFTNQAAKQRTNELNFGAGEDRWRQALQTITNFSNPSFPQAPAPGGSAIGSALTGIGSSFLDQAIQKFPWGTNANA